jgi:hypothetical protein
MNGHVVNGGVEYFQLVDIAVCPANHHSKRRCVVQLDNAMYGQSSGHTDANYEMKLNILIVCALLITLVVHVSVSGKAAQ